MNLQIRGKKKRAKEEKKQRSKECSERARAIPREEERQKETGGERVSVMSILMDI